MMFDTHKQPHGDCRIARAAKDRVVQEQHDDRAAAAQRDARIARPDGHNLPATRPSAAATAAQKSRRDSDNERNRQAQHDGLHSRDRRIFRILSRRCAAPPWPWSDIRHAKPIAIHQRQH